MNVCRICAASLNTILFVYLENMVWFPITTYACITYFIGWQKKDTKKKHVTAPILKPTYDQKPETFFLAWSKGTTLVITRTNQYSRSFIPNNVELWNMIFDVSDNLNSFKSRVNTFLLSRLPWFLCVSCSLFLSCTLGVLGSRALYTCVLPYVLYVTCVLI